jgi:hypothetical protein
MVFCDPAHVAAAGVSGRATSAIDEGNSSFVGALLLLPNGQLGKKIVCNC